MNYVYESLFFFINMSGYCLTICIVSGIIHVFGLLLWDSRWRRPCKRKKSFTSSSYFSSDDECITIPL